LFSASRLSTVIDLFRVDLQLKRMKQIEQEKDTLMQGLQAVERAREWYLKQVAAVTEKIKYLGRMGSHMVSTLVSLFRNLEVSASFL